MNSIVFVNFECNESTKVVAQKIWQYDYGQILRIQGLNLPAAVEIHFSLQKTGGAAKRRIGVTRDGVTDVVIPDFILTGEGIERDYTAYAFIYLSTEESGQTEHRIELNIKSRPEPEGSTGSDETSFGAIMDAIKTFAAGKADGLKYENSILKLMSGETELARVTITGGGSGGTAREIELQKSDTAIQWKYVGDEEWTDLVLLEELKGEKGDPGEGGKTAYQYAQDGGYTGTEEEFAKKLAQENPTREEFSRLSATVNDLKENGTGGETGTGLSTEAINKLEEVGNYLAYSKADGGSKWAEMIAILRNGSSSEEEPDTPKIPVIGISLDKSSESIYTGHDTTVTATITPLDATNKSIVWTSSNDSIAKIEGNGNTVTIKGISDGSSVITAKTVDGDYIDTFTVTVATAKVTGITLSNTTGDLVVGGAFELTANITPVEATNKTVIWTTSNDAIATVTPSADTLTATVTAIGEGTATITATTNESGKTATFTANISGVELAEITPTLLVREGTNDLHYAYVFDDYASVDTADTSKIKQFAQWRDLHFDCSNASKIRIKRYVNKISYSTAKPIYAYNKVPDLKMAWVSDASTAQTNDVQVPFPVKLTGSDYLSPKPSIGDVVTVGDFELEDGYKHLVIMQAYGITMNKADASTDLNDYKNDEGYWVTNSENDWIKIYVVE